MYKKIKKNSRQQRCVFKSQATPALSNAFLIFRFFKNIEKMKKKQTAGSSAASSCPKQHQLYPMHSRFSFFIKKMKMKNMSDFFKMKKIKNEKMKKNTQQAAPLCLHVP